MDSNFEEFLKPFKVENVKFSQQTFPYTVASALLLMKVPFLFALVVSLGNIATNDAIQDVTDELVGEFLQLSGASYSLYLTAGFLGIVLLICDLSKKITYFFRLLLLAISYIGYSATIVCAAIMAGLIPNIWWNLGADSDFLLDIQKVIALFIMGVIYQRAYFLSSYEQMKKISDDYKKRSEQGRFFIKYTNTFMHENKVSLRRVFGSILIFSAMLTWLTDS
ncbi:hypothetical protein [Vibrio aestuarianus]|uniref:hypothetical protein n=1 Tax=Vibrio aestuarianus TaxID=28171 RepID=UPI00237D1205|nr:hypothetical protein [Vibrio aestuarianus]MDE1240513.1 hypothetical protein [Vibrio aestuarianus]